MKYNKRIFHLGGALVVAATMFGCNEDDLEPIFAPPDADIVHTENPSYIDYELMYNYDILDLFYSYAHTNNELADYETYANAKNYAYSSKSACTSEYAKVCNMYADMSCPFTRYFSPSYAERIMDMLSASESATGIGAEVKAVKVGSDYAIVVEQIYEDGPAYKAGLMEGDTIISVNGNSIKDMYDYEDYMEDHAKGERLTVIIQRGGSPITIRIVVDEINLPTVHLSFKDSIPVIKVDEFTSTTSSKRGTHGEFINALKKIKDDYKAAIIDLRGNPGGDVEQCVNMSAELLNANDTIIVNIETNADSAGSRDEKEYFQKFDTTAYTAEVDGIGKDLYYVFLADSGSASCAELMLSAVTVNKHSPVVGLTTYGKGIGQFVIQTYTNGLALVTGLQSTDKNGDIYHKVGIVPDFKSGDAEEQMATAVEWAKERTKTRRTEGFYGNTSTGHFPKAKALEEDYGFPTNKKALLKQMSGAYKIKGSAN